MIEQILKDNGIEVISTGKERWKIIFPNTENPLIISNLKDGLVLAILIAIYMKLEKLGVMEALNNAISD